ncbi:molybdate ABC transporter substrate-binding protein [Endozoicomonas sp. YOMI1]|uniref:molybdate ABC transporter substrate-binding protein n=1 Tax=Endozoicomonas sp. YOMI1 TaxID=2828739 RepID=UPI0021477495|nr:molybdate ABC transporter substrate-binding protein [Endozoicomonas sp. YOMI1]
MPRRHGGTEKRKNLFLCGSVPPWQKEEVIQGQFLRTLFLAFLLFCPGVSVFAVELKVAVAANFKPSLEVLAKAFEAETGHRLLISSASTGVLYNQITHGAPFDIFLSADSLRAELLEKKGLTLEGSRHPYALGGLVLWSPGFSGKDDQDKTMTLEDLAFYKGRLAIANPATAPYGLAARQVLEKLGFWSSFRSRLVQGASIQQAWQFVASGNIPAGLVAKAQLVDHKNNDGHIFSIPATLYDPIQQDLVILKRTRQPEAAKAFVAFILSPSVQSTIAKQGYFPVSTTMVDKTTSENRRKAL